MHRKNDDFRRFAQWARTVYLDDVPIHETKSGVFRLACYVFSETAYGRISCRDILSGEVTELSYEQFYSLLLEMGY
jgi:hypothetical protein